MQAFLEFRCPQSGELRKVSCDQLITIGRDHNNLIALSDPSISRNHSIVRSVGHNCYYLLDAGSSNGTILNGRRITEPVRLRDKDQIQIGNIRMIFDDDGLSANTEYTNYANSDVAETLVVSKPPLQRTVLLVADIRGYTAMSEKLSVTDLTKIMTYWFQRVQTLVESHGGVVDKFIGDCVLAFWDTGGVDISEQSYAALDTAQEIHELTTMMHELFPKMPENARIGVGINLGEVAVTSGAAETIMGDAVNTAFRLETATKELRKDIILNKSFFRNMPEILAYGSESKLKVKGKEVELDVLGLDFDALGAFLDN